MEKSGGKRVRVLDRDFVLMLSEEEILARVDAVAKEINNEFLGSNPLLLIMLNGAFMFASDLVKRITIPCEISFVKLTSYSGTASTGKVQELIGMNGDITGRNIVIVEDIVDSGLTMQKMGSLLEELGPKRVAICSLFVKRGALQVPITVDFAGFEIGNEFIVGYGLDYNQQGRNLRDLYVVEGNK